MTRARLTPAMQRVLQRMADGWDLCAVGGDGFDRAPQRVELRQRGRGDGGAVERVHGHAFAALVRNGFVSSRGPVLGEGARLYTRTTAATVALKAGGWT